MEELKNKLKEKLQNLNFEEMKGLLKTTRLNEARGVILEVMENNFPKEFEKMIEEY